MAADSFNVQGSMLDVGCSLPKISFLIPLYNGLELTRVCLRTLEETVDLTPHEVILINDASADGTKEFLDTLRAPYRVIHHDRQSGYAKGMNRGATLARGQMICLLNNDLVFRPGWLPPMLRAFEKFPRAGMVGNVQINPRTGQYDHMGVIFNPKGSPIHFGTGFKFCPFTGYSRWKAITAACCLVKREVFLKAGGFDEAYVNGFEDIDLCLKLGEMGYQNYVANGSVVGHHVSSSEGRGRFELQNGERFQEKWHDQMPKIVTARERRLFAINYLLRCLCNRSHFRAKKAGGALLMLITCGH